jgi:drug/metabolite transporter (DMT)-like permease
MNKLSQKSSGKFIGEAALLLMTIIWGGTFVIVKESLDDISTLLFVGLRFGIAAVVLFIVLSLKKIKIDKKIILPGALLGGWLFLGFLTQTAGLKFTSASKSGFLTGSLVVMIPLFQTIIEKKIPTRGALIGTALVFLGIVFLSSGGNSISDFFNNLGNNFNIGDWLTLMCAAFFALHIVFMDIISPKYEFWNLLFFQLATVAVLNLFFSLVFSYLSIEPLRFSLSNNLLIGILYTALLATLVNFALQTKFQKVVSPTKAGIIYSFEPVFAAVFTFFILNEKITNFGLVGCAMIFLGLIVSEVFDSFFSQKDGYLEVQIKNEES